MAALPSSSSESIETYGLNLGTNHVPHWTVQHAVAELVANAIDQDQDFKYELSDDAATLVIENRGCIEPTHWVMNATGNEKKSVQNGGFGCGMKDALPPLHRKRIGYTCESHDTKYELDVVKMPKIGEVLVLNVSSLAVMRPGTTRITLTAPKGVKLPRREDVCFTVPPGATPICKMQDMEIYTDRPIHSPVVIWLRDVYKFEVKNSVGGYLIKVLKFDQAMREQLGRDRRNASNTAFHTFIKNAYCCIRDAGFKLPAAIPQQFRPPAKKTNKKAKAPAKKPAMPDLVYVDKLQKDVVALEHWLTDAELQRNVAVEDLKQLQKDHRRLQDDYKRLQEIDDMARELMRRLATLRLPTFSTSKPADNDKRMEEWIESKKPSLTFQSQVKEIRETFQAAFLNGQCAFYGSSSDGSDTALNDSDVDLAVMFPIDKLKDLLATKIPLLTIRNPNEPKHVQNYPTAKLYNWKYKDSHGEVMVFPNADDFKLMMDDCRDDPLSNLSARETKGVKFMKRLRIAAFGGLHPKSRVLTHVVHKVHAKDSTEEKAKEYSYSRYVPLYLDTFLNLSATNFPSYHRYCDEEWSLLKEVIQCVKESFAHAKEEGAAA